MVEKTNLNSFGDLKELVDLDSEYKEHYDYYQGLKVTATNYISEFKKGTGYVRGYYQSSNECLNPMFDMRDKLKDRIAEMYNRTPSLYSELNTEFTSLDDNINRIILNFHKACALNTLLAEKMFITLDRGYKSGFDVQIKNDLEEKMQDILSSLGVISHVSGFNWSIMLQKYENNFKNFVNKRE